jgi:arylsulfatase A-like enzyme
MVVKWPGTIIPGSTCDEPVISTDFYPTILEMAGIQKKPEQIIDGMSFIPLLRGRSIRGDRALFWHYPHYGNQGGSPGAAIRKGEYKLIEFFEEDRETELYNIDSDISEKHNLADSLPEIRDQLRDLLHSWQDKMDARFPNINPDYEENK